MISWRTILPVAAIAAFFMLSLYATHLRGEVKAERAEKQKVISERDAALVELASTRTQQRQIAEMDKRLTEELVNAKNTITQLERDVADGKRRLYIKAKCPATTASGLADASAAGLTNTAQRDYFILRERIEQSNRMILGLQGYITNVCLSQ